MVAERATMRLGRTEWTTREASGCVLFMVDSLMLAHPWEGKFLMLIYSQSIVTNAFHSWSCRLIGLIRGSSFSSYCNAKTKKMEGSQRDQKTWQTYFTHFSASPDYRCWVTLLRSPVSMHRLRRLILPLHCRRN